MKHRSTTITTTKYLLPNTTTTTTRNTRKIYSFVMLFSYQFYCLLLILREEHV